MNRTVNLAKQKIEEILSNNGEFNICKSGVCFTVEFVNNQLFGFFYGFEILPILIFELVHALESCNHFFELLRVAV